MNYTTDFIICKEKLEHQNANSIYTGCLYILSDDNKECEPLYQEIDEKDYIGYYHYEGDEVINYPFGKFSDGMELSQHFDYFEVLDINNLADIFFYTILEAKNRNLDDYIYPLDIVEKIAIDYYAKDYIKDNKTTSMNKLNTLKDLVKNNFIIPPKRNAFLAIHSDKELIRSYYITLWQLCQKHEKNNDPQIFWNWLKNF